VISFEQSAGKLDFEKVRARAVRYAASEPGKQMLHSIPILTSVPEIRSELSRVTEMKRLLEEEEDFPLEGIHPIKTAVQKASVEGAVVLSRDLLHISSTLRSARVIRTFVARIKERYPLIWEIAESLYTDKVLEFNIDQAVDESGAVRTSASKDLQSIRRAISERYENLKKRLETVLKDISDLGFSQDEIITTREGRMVIPVKAEHKNRVPGFIHSASSSGATVFIEPAETLDLNNEIRSLQFQEQREVERILRALTVEVGNVREKLLSNLTVLARLDTVCAKAKYSIEILGSQPAVNDSGPLKLAQARHPVLMMNHGYKETVPMDLEIGGSYNSLVISGPNAGGKSVAMKCVGLLVLMTQAGLHIPAADQSIIRIFKKIFVDIGDEQSIENDLSTFSSHLVNLKAIGADADAESLVLIDEIGSGTDPAEGGAIAASLLETLTSRGATTIATTHHGALKVFAHVTSGIENGAMEFDQETLTPTYRFKSGIPGSSYALEMAGRLGFEPSLLERSREILGGRQVKLEALIAELESSAQRYRRDIESLTTEKAKVDDLLRQYESKLSAVAKEVKEIKRNALDQANDIVDRANAVIERSIKEIKETGADGATIKGARTAVAHMKNEIAVGQKAVAPEPGEQRQEPLQVGSLVNLAGSVEAGEIESISADGKTAVVVFGNMKMKAGMTDLTASRSRKRSFASAGFTVSEKPGTLLHGLDLRGKMGEEALPLVDKFLDDALLAGLQKVDIIHGKGTGALRKKVTEYLSHHPRVKSFRLGEWNEGGTGATIVELKDS